MNNTSDWTQRSFASWGFLFSALEIFEITINNTFYVGLHIYFCAGLLCTKIGAGTNYPGITYSLIISIANKFFLYLGKKVPVRRTGAYRHKKPCFCAISKRAPNDITIQIVEM